VAIQREPLERSFEEEALAKLTAGRTRLLEELRRVIVGQDQVIEEIMLVLFSGAHCLITGAPGLAKTLLIRSVARILGLRFQRIQFTPDLMPSDITGTEIIDEERASGHRELRFIPGPVFTNILLADEINRTPPKTQAALLEAMEEKQVTVAGEPRPLNRPFYVLATQNPIELEGTYPLPEAQLDRFMLNIRIGYLDEDEELAVATRTTSDLHAEPKCVFTGEDMLDFARLVRLVPVAEPIARYAVRLVQATRPESKSAPAFIRDWVSWGAGTRGSQSLLLAAKARALIQGRFHVSCADLKAVARPVLRHRVLTNFRAEADGIDTEEIVGRLLDAVEEPKSSLLK
jgi:MoxR-like ATPase